VSVHDWNLGAIARFWQYVSALIEPPFAIFDRTRFTRRAAFMLALWLGWTCFAWARAYADAHPQTDGAQLGLIIAAVTGPASLLIGWMFRIYTGDAPGAEK
jgi:hypothetical protein